jgi:non-ribosomal peptide synthetase component F
VFRAEQQLLPHRRYPMARLQKSRSGQPLFETAFNFNHFHVYQGVEGLAGVEVTNPEIFEYTNFTLMANFDLDPASAELTVRLNYDSGQLTAAQAKGLSGYYLRTLEAMVSDADAGVFDADLLSEAERTEVVDGFNATDEAYPLDDVCLHELFERQVQRTPDAVALVWEEGQWTYAELNARANRLAHRLRELGVGPDVPVGVCLERSPEMVVSLYAVLKAGGAYLPLDPEYPASRLASILEDSGLELVLAQEALTGVLGDWPGRVLAVDTQWDQIAAEDDTNPAGISGPEHLAYVIYTSGSTGRPKGVMVEHAGICNRLWWMQQEYGLTGSDRVLQKTPYSFDVSVWEFFWPLLTGASLVVARSGGHQDASYLAELIRRTGVRGRRVGVAV